MPSLVPANEANDLLAICIAVNDSADIKGKVGKPGVRSGFDEELPHREAPARRLVAGVLTDDAIEPAFDPVGRSELLLAVCPNVRADSCMGTRI